MHPCWVRSISESRASTAKRTPGTRRKVARGPQYPALRSIPPTPRDNTHWTVCKLAIHSGAPLGQIRSNSNLPLEVTPNLPRKSGKPFYCSTAPESIRAHPLVEIKVNQLNLGQAFPSSHAPVCPRLIGHLSIETSNGENGNCYSHKEVLLGSVAYSGQPYRHV